MINCQKFNLLLFLTLNSVTTGVRELNGACQISLVTHDAKANARDVDEVSSGLARMVINYLIDLSSVKCQCGSIWVCTGIAWTIDSQSDRKCFTLVKGRSSSEYLMRT